MTMGSEERKCFWLETSERFGDDGFESCLGLVAKDGNAHCTGCRVLWDV